MKTSGFTNGWKNGDKVIELLLMIVCTAVSLLLVLSFPVQ